MFHRPFGPRSFAAGLIALAFLIVAPVASLANPEVHAVGIYEGNDTTDGRIHGPEAHVMLDRPGAEVVLLLGAYGATRWFVDATPETAVVRIIVHGNKSERSEVILNGVPYQGVEYAILSTAYKPTGKAFRDFVQSVRENPDLGRLDSFVGTYRAPEEPMLLNSSEPDNPIYQPDRLKTLLADPSGVPEALRAALDLEAPRIAPQVVLKGDGFHVSVDGSDAEVFPITLDVPEVSWPVGAARDDAGNLYGVTLGGEGYLYKRDAANGQWSILRSMKNADATGMIHDADRRRLVIVLGGLVGKPAILLQPIPAGKASQISLDYAEFPGLTDLFDPGNGPAPGLVPLAISGDHLLLWAGGNGFPASAPNPISASRTYLVDLASGAISLVAYRNEKTW